MMGTFKDVVGKEFASLRVVAFAGRAVGGGSTWRCLCAVDLGGCGRETIVRVAKLNNGHTKSCGCRRDRVRGVSSITHGATRGRTRTGKMPPEYTTWRAMRHRCMAPSCKKFPRYGGRGIRICDRWQDFAVFLADMGPKPSPNHTIERVDNDGHYEPGNCRWATQREQQRNRSSNTVLELDGVRRCLAEWVDVTGINLATIQARKRSGWSDKDTLTIAASHGNRRLRLSVRA